MKIGIIGYGFVGQALSEGLKENVEAILIKNVSNTKNKSRSSYSNITDREVQQNIKYNDQEELI